jgi:flagellar biosynthesis chaperone FliJ
MATPEYRLQLILEQREDIKKECQRAVTEAEKALKLELKKLDERIEDRKQVDVRKERATTEFHAAMMRPGCNIAEEADRHDWYQKAQDAEAVRCDEAIEAQKQEVRRAESHVEETQRALDDARIDVEALLKHKEKWSKQIKREEMEKEQAALDELGEAMWLQQQREAARRTTSSEG